MNEDPDYYYYYEQLKIGLAMIARVAGTQQREVIICANLDKAEGVRIANFCRNNGYKAKLQTVAGVNWWVKVTIN